MSPPFALLMSGVTLRISAAVGDSTNFKAMYKPPRKSKSNIPTKVLTSRLPVIRLAISIATADAKIMRILIPVSCVSY
jgi:hypothetical protein